MSSFSKARRTTFSAPRSEKVLTQHPQGKKGVRIDKDKYDAVCAAILRALRSRRGMTHTELTTAVQQALRGLPGSIAWYVESVKLDLEAQEKIERIPQTRPEQYRLRAG